MYIPYRRQWNILREHLGQYKKRIAALCVLMLVSNGLLVISPQIIRYYIDTVTTSSRLETVWNAAFLYMGIGVVQLFVSIVAVAVTRDLAWRVTNRIRINLMSHCMKLDMTFHNKHKPGEMIERIDGDVSLLSAFVSDFVANILANVVLLLGVLIAVGIEDLRICMVFFAFSAAALLILVPVMQVVVPFWKAVREKGADLYGFIEESVTNLEDIVTTGGQDYVRKNFHRRSRETYKATRKAVIVQRMVFGSIINGILAILIVLVFGIGIPMHDRGTITLGTLYLLWSYALLILTPLTAIAYNVQRFHQASAGIERIEELLQVDSAIRDSGNLPFPPGPVSVSFEGVSFAYGEGEQVLHSLNFTMPAGRSLGLIGRTGSGKTTVARLIFRLYDITSGRLTFNDVDARNIMLPHLRENTAIVTQDVELFAASLRDNITLFDTTFSDDELLRVIKELGLEEWLERLPNGLDTKLKTKESGLSAGEAQLVAMARVLIRNPSIVVLDEASSRIDPATERLVQHALRRLLENRAAIVIAHRLDTLDIVDDILILEKGRVREFGSRQELAEDPSSFFSRLLRTGFEEVLA